MILAEQALRWAQRKFYLMQFWLRNLTFKVGFFQFFRKSRKVAILFCRFHHENSIPRKNGVHHEKANGKSNKTVDSDFSFSKFCHRDFSPQSSILLKKKWSSVSEVFKETIAAFKRLNRFSLSICQNKEPEHFGIFGSSDKKIWQILFGFANKSIYSKFSAESSVLEVFKETIAAFKRLNRFSISICKSKRDKNLKIRYGTRF